MILLPAVDIRDGRAVRLRQGQFEDETVYADDPLDAARSFVEAGARFLHVVGLDGAREGEPVNLHHVERIAGEVDVRGGQVAVAGWTRETQVPGEDAIRRMQQRGATRFVYTNVDRDGMLEGPDLEEVRRVSAAVRGRFPYSGGIGSIDDLRALRSLRLLNLAGVISGKALYEGRFSVRDGQGAIN